MAWKASTGHALPHRHPEWDQGGEAHRIVHIESDSAFPLAMSRFQDAVAGAEFLNKECPCNGLTEHEVVSELKKVFKNYEGTRRRIIEECCAW